MLLLKLQELEERTATINQESCTTEEASLVSLTSTEQGIQVSSQPDEPVSCEVSQRKILDKSEQPSRQANNYGTDEQSQKGKSYNNHLKIEDDILTSFPSYVADVEEVEPTTEASSTGYAVEGEEYLAAPEEDEQEELEVGDHVVELLSGIKGVVVGFKDGRVVFDCTEFGRCSRPAIMLQKI